jgi:SAM-dependent methyltransferase
MVASEMKAMMENDERHWWYRGRRHVMRAVLGRLDLPAAAQILDAGCGSGRMLDELAAYGHVAGVDLSRDAVALARGRGHRDVRVGRIEQLPFRTDAFDLVTCLDVVEHTPDDRRTLSELRRVTRAGGRLVVTVPAYQALWSSHDVVNEHYRRYRAASLRSAAEAAGWELVRDTYFNSMLLVPAAVVRLAERGGPAPTPASRSDLAVTPEWLNAPLVWPLRAEARAIGAGRRLPAGLSLLAVLRNPDVTTPRRREMRPRRPVAARAGVRSDAVVAADSAGVAGFTRR